ncbi:MAG: DUF4097 domain-containing protein, partial [Arenicella sp.]|nr:DUF4097 domain-containing protein [Arenicella sp.]
MRYLTGIFLMAITATVVAGDEIDSSLPASKDGKVTIRVVSGDVAVKSWSKAEVRVVGEVGDDKDKFVFEKVGDGTLIEVKSRDKGYGHSWHSDSVDLTITVPENSVLDATSMSADMDFNDVQGSIRAGSTSGDIDLEDCGGALKVETVSGDIQITNGGGKINVSSVSGDIETESNTTHYDANTVSGDVEAKLGRVEVLDFTSVSGDFEVQFDFADDGQIDAHTVSGDMLFDFENVPANARFDLQTGPGGDIENGLSKDRADESFIGSE